jgi:hypothetical protein
MKSNAHKTPKGLKEIQKIKSFTRFAGDGMNKGRKE